ncbi:MAG: glycosyltransferase family 4 protein [Phycisphaerae bacterium]
MRITILLPPDDLSGRIRVFALYADRLRKRGHTVTVVQPRHRRPALRRSVLSLLRGRGWPRTPDVGPSYFDDVNVKRLKLPHTGPISAEDVPDADVIVGTWWETAEWAWGLPPSKGNKVHFMQDYEIWGGQTERVDAVCRLPMPKIVVAKWVANLLMSRFGQDPIALVPHSVETRVFHADPRGKQKSPTVGFVYSPMRNKGTDVVLRAIELARKQIPDLKVIAFGASAVTPEMNLPRGTEYFCRVPDRELRTLYASCDAWLVGSRIEGFGLPVLEAMACRTPVIATPAGAAPELIGYGGGIMVPMEDPEGMAAGIFRVVHMSAKGWGSMSDQALATATSYTWDDATDRLEAALEQVRVGVAACEEERPRSRGAAGVG